MAYFLFLLANAALFVRPGELSPDLAGLPVYLCLIVGAIIGGARELTFQLRWRTLVQQPVNLCVVGVWLAVMLSHLSNMDADAMLAGTTEMGKVMVYYLLLVGLITTPVRFRTFLATTALASTVMVAISIDSYRDFVEEWDGNSMLPIVLAEDKDRELEDLPPLLAHVVESHGETVEGDPDYVYRMCGLGVFHDPNDVALLIVVTLIISGYFLTDRQLGLFRVSWLIPIGICLVGLACTQSRGGVLAAGVGAMAWLALRYGGAIAAAIGTMGLGALPLAMGRMGDIDVSSGTGQDRIRLWSDGLEAISGPRMLFGIGEGMYEDYAGLVAHNSYVHAFVELGLVGGTFFVGCAFFPLVAFRRMSAQRAPLRHPELHRLRPYVLAMLAAWCMGMCSLSRCYTPSTYMVFGASAAFINLAGFYQRRPAPLVMMNSDLAPRWILASLGVLAAAFVFVRLFATYS